MSCFSPSIGVAFPPVPGASMYVSKVGSVTRLKENGRFLVAAFNRATMTKLTSAFSENGSVTLNCLPQGVPILLVAVDNATSDPIQNAAVSDFYVP